MKAIMTKEEISALKVGDKVEIMLRDMVSGKPAWYPAVVNRVFHQTLEDYYECGNHYMPDVVNVTVTVNGVEYPYFEAHEGACRKA